MPCHVFFLEHLQPNKGKMREKEWKWQESEWKVRHSSATDGDSVAAWVEPSEGASVQVVCVCVWGGAPGYHDNPSRGRLRSESTRLAVARRAFKGPALACHLNPHPRLPPIVWPQEATEGDDHGGGRGCATWFYSQTSMEQCTPNNKRSQTHLPL